MIADGDGTLEALSFVVFQERSGLDILNQQARRSGLNLSLIRLMAPSTLYFQFGASSAWLKTK
jgi:hypothetical protein